MRWPSAKINNEGEEQKTNDRDDFDGGETEFGFTVDGYGKDVEANDQDDDE